MTPSKPNTGSIYQKGQPSPARHHTPLQEHLLERLAELVQRRQELAGPMSGEGGRFLGLIHRAIFAAYVDCLEEGVGDEALGTLRQENLAAAA